jgi:Holliday junction resolvase RusA-like endonuclease
VTITLVVNGTPKGQPRVKAYNRGGHAGVYTPDTANGWKEAVRIAAIPHRPEQPIDCPVTMELDVYFPRPKRLDGKKHPDGKIAHTAKPDSDNVAKAIMDVLTDSGFVRDDAVIYRLNVRKFYAARGAFPGAFIRLTTEAA